MGLVNERMNVNLSGLNIKYYENLGYDIPKVKDGWNRMRVPLGSILNIKTMDLPKNSNVYIEYFCDVETCKKIKKVKWQTYLKCRKEDGKSYCYKCSHTIFQKETIRKVLLLKNGKSFKDYCLEEKLNSLLKRWDKKLNKLSPDEVSFSSSQRFYFKCPKNIHESEKIKLGSITHTGIYTDCKMCNSVGVMFPISLNLWSDKNKKTPYEYRKKSGVKVYWKCENDKHDDYIRDMVNSVKVEFRCPSCAQERNESLLQEKVRLYLEQIKYNNFFIRHEQNCVLKLKNPKTGYPLHYDNEIISDIFKLIIEVHGGQHYVKGAFKQKGKEDDEQFEYIQWKDKIKKEHALNNGYLYLEIPYTDDDKKETWKIKINQVLKEFLN